MSNTSQPTDSSITLDDTITISSTVDQFYIDNTMIGDISITLDSSAAVAQGIYTITTNDTIDIGSIFDNLDMLEEWKSKFPDWDRVQGMCEKYPGLKIAFENFKMFYEMVKDDYDNPKD